jgi:hypothetical protein
MYLLSPPRVGVDGRLMRETALRQEVPIVIIVREPTTKAGLWPIVAVGPVTVRARLAPPLPHPVPTRSDTGSKNSRTPAKGPKAKTPKEPPGKTGAHPVPTPEWMLLACEALGDAAIANVSPTLSPVSRVMALAERLEAVPDHEKLHQRLEEAAREAARLPVKRSALAKLAARDPLED